MGGGQRANPSPPQSLLDSIPLYAVRHESGGLIGSEGHGVGAVDCTEGGRVHGDGGHALVFNDELAARVGGGGDHCDRERGCSVVTDHYVI